MFSLSQRERARENATFVRNRSNIAAASAAARKKSKFPTRGQVPPRRTCFSFCVILRVLRAISGRLNPNSEAGAVETMGGTGNLPVPAGYQPAERRRGLRRQIV